MYCRNCGEKLEDNIKFCGKCGIKCNENKSNQKISFVKEFIIKIKKLDKRILIALGVIIVLIILLTSGVFGKRYTKKMELFRESSSWMYLYTRKDGSSYKYGELLDIALKNSKWEEVGNTITITGKDSNTKENIEIIIKIEEDDIDFVSFTKGNQETTSFTSFYGWIYGYADIERKNGR